MSHKFSKIHKKLEYGKLDIRSYQNYELIINGSIYSNLFTFLVF